MDAQTDERLNEIVAILNNFIPNFREKITPQNRRDELINQLRALTRLEGINDNYGIINAFSRWESYVKSILGTPLYNRFISGQELFTDPAMTEKDLNVLTVREIISKYGVLAAFNFTESPQEFELQRQRFKALFDETKLSTLRSRLQSITQDEAIMNNQVLQEQSEIDYQIAENNRQIQTKTQELDRIRNDPIYQQWNERYTSYRNAHRSMGQIRNFMRGLSNNQFTEFMRNYNSLSTLNNEIEQLTHQNNDLNNRRSAINIESNQPIIERMNQLRPAIEQRRTEARENYVNQLITRRAHNQEEHDQLAQDILRLARQPIDKIENYFNNSLPNQDKINAVIEAVRNNARVNVSNLNNDERSILKPRLLQAMEQNLQNIPAEATVRLLIGRNNSPEGPKSITLYTKEQAIEFLRNWTQEGIIIQYDNETHYQLTGGDRYPIAPFWTVDWFQITINNNPHFAPGGGYPKFYFKRTGSDVVIKDKSYSEDIIAECLKKYQIPDHIPTSDDSEDMLEPCLIHVILQLDSWTDRQRLLVKELLYSRIKYVHVSAADAAIIFQELDINAVIRDFDNKLTLEYYRDGRCFEEVKGEVKELKHTCNYESVKFGLYDRRRKNPPTLKLVIYKKHYILDEITSLGVSSIFLIKKLEEQNRIAPLTKIDSRIYHRQLTIPKPVFEAKSYYHTCWKNVDEVIAGIADSRKFSSYSIPNLKLSDESALKQFKSTTKNGSIGLNLILNYMKEKNYKILADSGTVKQFLSRSTRGAVVAVADNKPIINKEPITSLDMNSCYWYALQNINVGRGFPCVITNNMTYDDVRKIINDGGIVFLSCSYKYIPQHCLDVNNKKELVLTNYDLLNPAYEVDTSQPISGFYWSGNKVLRKPFYELVEKMYYLRKHVNNELKHLLNAGIGKLIHKYKPYYHRAKHFDEISTNINCVGEDEIKNEQGETVIKEKWINPLDYEYNFTQIHSLILSYVQLHLQKIFLQCQSRGVRMLYTSTDSLVIPSADVPKLSDFIDNYKLGFFKCEASTDSESVFVGRGLYYINENKYGTLNVPHKCVEQYCKRNKISLLEFYKQLAGGKVFKNMWFENHVYSLRIDSFRTLYSKTILLS